MFPFSPSALRPLLLSVFIRGKKTVSLRVLSALASLRYPAFTGDSGGGSGLGKKFLQTGGTGRESQE
jgi:hypothetical protein